jgi:hypothetical protein
MPCSRAATARTYRKMAFVMTDGRRKKRRSEQRRVMR